MKLAETDTYPPRTTIWLRDGHTFTKRGEAWFCACEPNAWRYPNVVNYAKARGVAALDVPGQDVQVAEPELTMAASGAPDV